MQSAEGQYLQALKEWWEIRQQLSRVEHNNMEVQNTVEDLSRKVSPCNVNPKGYFPSLVSQVNNRAMVVQNLSMPMKTSTGQSPWRSVEQVVCSRLPHGLL